MTENYSPVADTSIFNAHGPDAAVIAEMGTVVLVGGAIVFAVVMALAAYAVFGARERASRLSVRALVVGGGVAFPAVTLTALLVYSVVRAAGLYAPAGGEPLRIEVIGEQWWWRVHYLDREGGRDFATANEIRVPVNRTVELTLRSADVLHSFWVPNLAGKLDMIPGRANRMRLRAARAGAYRGQCAEYCGGPHALMAFFVVAEEAPAYERWAARQREPAKAAEGDAPRRGEQLFGRLCAGCHAVRGTAARGTLGPDLTHVGGRLTLGAGLLKADAAALAAWIATSQRLKPGNLMPAYDTLPGEDVRALAAYLEALR